MCVSRQGYIWGGVLVAVPVVVTDSISARNNGETNAPPFGEHSTRCRMRMNVWVNCLSFLRLSPGAEVLGSASSVNLRLCVCVPESLLELDKDICEFD